MIRETDKDSLKNKILAKRFSLDDKFNKTQLKDVDQNLNKPEKREEKGSFESRHFRFEPTSFDGIPGYSANTRSFTPKMMTLETRERERGKEETK